MSEPAPPRLAATVIIATPEATDGFEVFLVKRTHKSGFMAGAHVFPGGILDSQDSEEAWRGAFEAKGLHDLPEDFAFRLASIREAFEESGVLLIQAPSKLDSMSADDLKSWRVRVHEDASTFQTLCAELGSLPDVFALKAWAHWITPTAEPRRYDTRFYVAWQSTPPDAHHDEKETVASTWLSAPASVRLFEAGEMFLPPPTWFILRELSAYRTWSEIQQAAREDTPIQPWFGMEDGSLVLALPGDVLHHDNDDAHPDSRNRIIILSNGKYSLESNLGEES